MNGEIPSVPITTLAGIASLTDLLPEMPLPSPLPQTLSNKSLLFHPRVAEEAHILLSLRDEALVPQLVQSLAQTSADHIELKDHYSGAVTPVDELNTPELLKAILQRNPNVFKGPLVNSQKSSATVTKSSQLQSPLESNHTAVSGLPIPPSPHPSLQPSPTLTAAPAGPSTPAPTPAPPHVLTPAPAPIPTSFPVAPTTNICDNHKPSTTPTVVPASAPSLSPSPASVSAKPEITQSSSANVTATTNGVRDTDVTPPPPPSLSNVPRANVHVPNMSDASPVQASSIAPVSDNKDESLILKQETPVSDQKLKEPRVMLNRIRPEDQALLQRSLKEFTEKEPSLAKEMGLTRNHRKMRIESGSESDEEPKKGTKYFKARDKEREIQRRKEKDLRKKDKDEEFLVDGKHWSANSKRKRSMRYTEPEAENEDSDDSSHMPKTKLRKVERKLVPVIEKLSVEELMETNTYQRFNKTLEKIFNNTEDVDLAIDAGAEAEDEVPSEAMIPKYQLQDLCGEAAKLKTLGAMESIPSEKITRLLSILEKNIRDGTKVSPLADPNDDEEERKLWMELAMERVMRAVDASLTTLYILTSPNMHKRVYLEDVIDRVVIFTKYQLLNTIFPSFDPVYRDSKDKDGFVGSVRKKRAHVKEVREKSVLQLYNKLVEVVSLLAELLSIQTLTDTAVLHISSTGISPFFVEGISELQLSALKLVTNIFTKYEKHRKLLLDDILASMARLPSSKRSLRSYRLNSEEQIQMLAALVLQLIQCMVVLPLGLGVDKQLDPDSVISNKFVMARTTASNFLYVFLAKCSSKTEEIDYRPIFENFVQDLLTTVNKPEWPAAELMLSVLGKLLVSSFANKSLEMSLRVVSLDYLGVVAARLRKDAVQSNLKLSTIDQIINEIKSEELKDDDGNMKGEVVPVVDDEERTQFLQKVLLDYLAVRGQVDPALTYARHFYLAQWYQDNIKQIHTSPKGKGKSTPEDSKRSNTRGRKQPETYEEESSENDEEDEERKKANGETGDPLETYRLTEARKKFLLSKIRPFDDNVSTKEGMKNQVLQTYIDYDSAELVSRYLASKRPFSQSFSIYLRQILTVLMESSVLIRTKAMKCLTMIVEVDPAVLGLKNMRDGVNYSFLDHSTSVREAAVDLVGKFVLSRPDLIDKYYDMLSARILDTGVSVRKRVIKILKDICIEYPEFPKIPEICVKMIRRVNDEDGIRKLVMEVFQNMWFTPVKEKPHIDKEVMIRKVMNITDVVAASKDMGLDWFEQLLVSLFKPKEDKDDSTKVSHEHSKALMTACKQIVDCLIENVLNLDGRGGGSSQRLIACLRTLHLFAKIKPQLLVEHAITLQPYLSLKCQTQGDYQIISSVAQTLEIIVPLIEHPSDSFLARLEEDSVKLIMRQDQAVILSCVSCLGSVVNNVTYNYKLIRDCFKKYHGILWNYKKLAGEGKEEEVETLIMRNHPIIKRSLFIVGLLLRFFDFTDKKVVEGLEDDTLTTVFNTFLFYLELRDLKSFTLKAIGSVCIRHYDMMLGPELKQMYHDILSDPECSFELKIQVLCNIEQYLLEEERRMIKQDLEWSKLSKQENLKEMGDVSSGMASTVIQIYLKEILESFLHPHVGVRQAALRVIQLILAQGLVHPVQIVPYLICMSTDEERAVSGSADKQLQDIEKKYPGFIHMKAQTGIRLSFKLQHILQVKNDFVRGFRPKEGELPAALNGFLYSILRTKQQRRALVLSILKQFDEQVKTSLTQMLYLADNMAYFPYQVQDEPLFIIHHIDIMISVTGTNLLQSFREALLPNPNAPAPMMDPVTGRPIPVMDEEDDEDEDLLLSRVPEDTSTLQECITASQGCLLLLVLKQHLKTLYGFNDSKITQYSPSESAKVYEKAVNRKSNAKFNPKATLQKIKQAASSDHLDEDAKRALLSEYLEFKHLIMNLDPDESDNDEQAQATPVKGHVSTRISGGGEHAHAQTPGSLPATPAQPPDDRVANHPQPPPAEPTPPLRVPKLTIVPPKPPDGKHHHHRSHKARKTERHKKHHHKRKKAKLRSSEDESDNEYSDPDFLV